jgi:hypothetical protein
MSNHLRCTCGFVCASLDDLFDHHDTAHDNPIPVATHRRGSLAVGKRKADDPYYAARDAARDPYDAEAFDRAILLERQREQRWLDADTAEAS